MISSVTNVDGSKRISIENSAKVSIELPEGFTFKYTSDGSTVIVKVVPKEGVSINHEGVCSCPNERMFIDTKAKLVQNGKENPNVLKKKRKFSPRLTREQKSEVLRLYKEEKMKKTAIAKKMQITFQQVDYCIKSV